MPLIYAHKMIQNLPETKATITDVMSVALFFKVWNYYFLREISDILPTGEQELKPRFKYFVSDQQVFPPDIFFLNIGDLRFSAFFKNLTTLMDLPNPGATESSVHITSSFHIKCIMNRTFFIFKTVLKKESEKKLKKKKSFPNLANKQQMKHNFQRVTSNFYDNTPTTLFLPSHLNTIPLYKSLVTFFPPLLLPPFYTLCFMHTALLSPLHASISLEFSNRLLCTEWIVSGFNSNDILMRSCSFTLQANGVTLPCQSLFRMPFWIISW